jgi:hypothetical protein
MEDHDTFIRSRFWQKQHARGGQWHLYCLKYVRLATIDPPRLSLRFRGLVSSIIHGGPWHLYQLRFRREQHARFAFWWLVNSIHFYGGLWHLVHAKIYTRATSSTPFKMTTRTRCLSHYSDESRWISVPYIREHTNILGVWSYEDTSQSNSFEAFSR